MKKWTLASALFPEVRQVERSAIRHSRKEAQRLGGCPPAEALIAVAEHAARTEASLQTLLAERSASSNSVGAILGAAFSIGRSLAGDYLLTAERSYRATLLGLRHGLDV